ncbi:MAG: N-acetyltransferase [Chloracidobacterium sp.]|uniref:GNAT family N-acetyltransferase n=1 Tax=Chloracidobacterium validum TaxID=2821543 RepID=A0ABX8B6W9_9BACT|nr:N-acetyltransferase [Chloracidobacterium validum]QUW02712.1 GNAT family N-acetyltransferase [Chloracidobacterium validum]
MPEALDVLPLNLLDAYACWELNRRCFASSETYDLATFRHLLDSPDSVSYKVFDGQRRMVGFLVGLVDREPTPARGRGHLLGSGHIIAVGVAPEARRQGHARRLLQAAEQGFRRRGMTMVHLEVHASNRAACQLYATAGYTVTQRLAHYYADGDDAFKMVKSLLEVTPAG